MDKFAFLFPGQGAQYVGMGQDLLQQYPIAAQVVEEASDIIGRDLRLLILEGPEELLTETANSQVAIYTLSVALLRVLQSEFPHIAPYITAGLSLGEYTALTAAGYLPFQHGVKLVNLRGRYMNETCEQTKGTMAVVLGLSSEQVEQAVKEANLPHDLWAANFNCPGQVVISGTLQGIEKGILAMLEAGAKRVMPLKVHGAFHSGLMKPAAEKLKHAIESTPWVSGSVPVVMNTTAACTHDIQIIQQNLFLQVCAPVKWEQSMRLIDSMHVDCYFEIGPGNTLKGFHKRIDSTAPLFSIEQGKDFEALESLEARSSL